MNFEKMHASWIHNHLENRTGERRGRLERGHREAEKLFCQNIWWMLRGNFDDLHPEFEVLDWRGLSYFCDFVWLTRSREIGYRNQRVWSSCARYGQDKYCNELNRETFLAAMGYQVISFAYDDVANSPRDSVSHCYAC